MHSLTKVSGCVLSFGMGPPSLTTLDNPYLEGYIYIYMHSLTKVSGYVLSFGMGPSLTTLDNPYLEGNIYLLIYICNRLSVCNVVCLSVTFFQNATKFED